MKNSRRSLLCVALALSACLASTAPAASLNVGDPAPKLQTGKFVQGDPVAEFLPGKAYIVEFWATWCGPCKASIPHLNETYNKFKDKGLIVIGQDCSEPNESKVPAFIKSMGDTMTYRVALDNKEGGGKGKMSETWMAAADQHGIPTAFLVDTTGHIAWIGHPMTLKDQVIEAVLAGTFNAKESAVAEKAQMARFEPFVAKLQTAMKQKEWDTAMATLDQMSKEAPDDAGDFLSIMRFKILTGKNDYPAAFGVIREMGEAHKGDPLFQNSLAWTIVSDKSIAKPDLELAGTLAQRAIDGSKEAEQKGMFMDTLARVKFMQGHKEEAVSLQSKAVAMVGDDQKDRLHKTLDSYQKGELPEAQ